MSSPTPRLTLRDLPLPAKLLVTTFLISVGLGYLWAMAQVHFKHAPRPAHAGIDDLVARFSASRGRSNRSRAEPEKGGEQKAKADAIGAGAGGQGQDRDRRPSAPSPAGR